VESRRDWATAYAYDNRAFVDKKPNSIADFFDVQAFPGRWAIRNDPSVIMEWALLADGVAADKIYETLETSDGLDRAFAQLDKIKPFVVWWENGRDPVRLLNSSEVTMSSIWAATGVEGAKEKDAHFSMGWVAGSLKWTCLALSKAAATAKPR
jgi:putative spermidine/putrescine transport system substrate-binding protein